MYQVRHTKAGDAAAEILMKMGNGWWWIHADEDEGFRMARVNSPEGDRLAKSGSPSLAGPFNRDTDLMTLANELLKAQRAEYVKEKKVYPVMGKSSLVAIRTMVLEALEDQAMTLQDMAKHCGTSTMEVSMAINTLRKYGRIVPRDEGVERRAGRAQYWRVA